MTDKTLKIAQDLHDLLKLKALQERRTLQDVTEELLRNGLEQGDRQVVEGMAEGGELRGNSQKPKD